MKKLNIFSSILLLLSILGVIYGKLVENKVITSIFSYYSHDIFAMFWSVVFLFVSIGLFIVSFSYSKFEIKTVRKWNIIILFSSIALTILLMVLSRFDLKLINTETYATDILYITICGIISSVSLISIVLSFFIKKNYK
tara:strand:+ start:3709 stop:4125 length:417 start_codon:yes stop_codon:yes gene_type:complete